MVLRLQFLNSNPDNSRGSDFQSQQTGPKGPDRARLSVGSHGPEDLVPELSKYGKFRPFGLFLEVLGHHLTYFWGSR